MSCWVWLLDRGCCSLSAGTAGPGFRIDDFQVWSERMPPALEAIRQLSEALFQYTHVDDMVRQTLHAALEVIGADAIPI